MDDQDVSPVDGRPLRLDGEDWIRPHLVRAASLAPRRALPDAWPSQSRLAHRAKQLLLRTPLRELFTYRYRFMFSPSQLCFLCQQITNTAEVPGSILEVGCAFGATTVFLNRHIDTLGIDVDYYAIDTFAGFTAKDISFEHALGRHYRYHNEFRGNSEPWFNRTMRRNGVRRVTSFRADATTFDYTRIAPLRFALVDVDLYRPVLAVLENIYDLVSPGGTIVTDDCQQGGRWGGAYDAFTEFTKTKGLDAIITADNLGLITKPRPNV
jgi:predicted O-methyltransferase YrrM